MKRILLLLVFYFVFGALHAQEYKSALGVKGAVYDYASLNFKHNFGKIYGDFRIGGTTHSIFLQGLVEFQKPIKNGFEWYWGFGGHIGYWNYSANSGFVHKDKYYNRQAYVGADVVFGLEYTFKFPLNLAVEVGPSARVLPFTWIYPNGAVAVRYAFK